MKQRLLLFTILLFNISFASAQSLPNGVVACYGFRGNGNDASTNAINATATGSPIITTGHTGNTNSAYNYNGTSQFFDAGNPALLNAKIRKALTISAWIKPTVTGGTQGAIVGKWSGVTAADQFLLMYDGTSTKKIVFAIGNPGNVANGVYSNAVLNVANTWTHVVATWDSTGTHKIYINGVLDKTTVLSQFTTINTTSGNYLKIGAQSNNGRQFKGDIDEVEIFNRALNAAEISNLYTTNEECPCFINTYNSTFCAGTSFQVGNMNYTSAGSYTDTLATSGGCDSVVYTNLSVRPNSFSNAYLQICAGDSVMTGGNYQHNAGNFIDTLYAATLNGCDSIITTHLTILNIPATNVNVQICNGDSLFAGGAFQYNTGNFSDTLLAASANGCDSIVNTNLVVTNTMITNINLSICAGDSIFAEGVYQNATGVYHDTLTAGFGCDSVIVRNLIVYQIGSSTNNTAICIGQSIFLQGANQTTAGTYIDTVTG